MVTRVLRIIRVIWGIKVIGVGAPLLLEVRGCRERERGGKCIGENEGGEEGVWCKRGFIQSGRLGRASKEQEKEGRRKRLVRGKRRGWKGVGGEHLLKMMRVLSNKPSSLRVFTTVPTTSSISEM